MKLNNLMNCDYDIEISGISTDSRFTKKGDLFFAVNGFNVDHFDFIDQAIQNGAVAIVSDRKYSDEIINIVTDDIDGLLVEVLNKFYDISDISLIGITGTDGKTTTSSVIYQILSPYINNAYLGTNGLDIKNKHYNTSNTTPCVDELYKCLNLVKNNKCSHVVMEVSSEALLHKRVDSLKFKIVCFTNITEDHLNVHKTLDNYINCKRHLLDLLNDDGFAIVNGDDKNCKSILHNNLITFGFDDDNDYVIYNVNSSRKFVNFSVKCVNSNIDICSPLTGAYNIYNVTMAYIVCHLLKLSDKQIIDGIRNLKPISGRREFLNFGQDYDIVLDYAHTLNGIKSLVNSFNDKNQLIVVTGAAGGREVSKREKIGKFLLENTFKVIFTMDDPRFEDPKKIVNDMIGNCKNTNYEIIIDREKAINYALSNAKENNIILIIGKGRDNYMAIKNNKIKYCDYDVIANYFNHK